MVKGITKRVIVVKSPDPKLFEQAFFIVREDIPGGFSSDSIDVLKEAQMVADNYIRATYPPPPPGLFPRFDPRFWAGLAIIAVVVAAILLHVGGII